jgi:hypothetical protein
MTSAYKILLRHFASVASLALLLALVCCARTSITDNSRANQNTNATRSNTTTETATQRSNSPGTSTPVTNQSPSAPDELVRQFYAWYLSELRDAKKPFEQEERMKQYVTDDFFGEIRKNVDDSRFDPALGLPKPESDWYKMKVDVAKPKYYNGKPYYDAYVVVKYEGFSDSKAYTRNGTPFVSIIDEWSIGLQRTTAGWRIASIGL